MQLLETDCRKMLDPSDHLLWDSLYNHFLVFLQHKVLSVSEIAEIFSPLLISGSSRLQKQVLLCVCSLTSTFSQSGTNGPSKLGLCARAHTGRDTRAQENLEYTNVPSKNVFAHISYTSFQIQIK